MVRQLSCCFLVACVAAGASAQSKQVAALDGEVIKASYSTSVGSESPMLAGAIAPVPSAPVRLPVEPTRSIALDASTLGAGLQMTFPVNEHVALRTGFHAMELSHEFKTSGFPYMASVSAKSFALQLDIAPFGGKFRVSPGVLAMNDIRATAHAVVPAGSSFDMGDGTYTSSASDPITADAKMQFGYNLSPMMTIGWHTILPNRWRITMPVEIGAVYTGAAKFDLNIKGSACDSSGYCGDIASDAQAQTDLNKERDRWTNTFHDYPFLPVVSIGVGYRFGGGPRMR